MRRLTTVLTCDSIYHYVGTALLGKSGCFDLPLPMEHLAGNKATSNNVCPESLVTPFTCFPTFQ